MDVCGTASPVWAGALAVVGLGCALAAFWPYLSGAAIKDPDQRAPKLFWLLIGGALFAAAIATFFVCDHSESGEQWWQGAGLLFGVLAAIAGVLLLAVSAVRISGTAMGGATRQAFTEAVAIGVVAIALLVAAFTFASASGWEAPPISALENSFEVLLLAAALTLVVLCGWSLRAWANAANPASAAVLQARRERAFDVSVVIASALGILVFVGIGASAFAARLAQREMEDLVRASDSQIAPERVLGAVDGMLIYDTRIALLRRLESDVEARQRAQRQTRTDFQTRALTGQSKFWNTFADFSAETGVVRDPPPPRLTSEELTAGLQQQYAPSFEDESRQLFVRSIQYVSALPLTDARARAANLLGRLRADLDEVRAVWIESDAAAAQLTAVQEGIRDARLAQECELRRLATAIDGTRPAAPAAAAAADAQVERLEREYNCQGAEAPTVEAYRDAFQLVGALRPLSRSWMSNSLARRAPITLSIELVLVMGALGAMLQAIGAQLARMLNIPLGPNPPPQLTLSTLGTQVLFGTATALALFVLLNVVIGASSLTSNNEPPQGDDLNPFAMAALGLIGGYSSLKVAEWMGQLLTDVLNQRGQFERRLAEIERQVAERARTQPPAVVPAPLVADSAQQGGQDQAQTGDQTQTADQTTTDDQTPTDGGTTSR